MAATHKTGIYSMLGRGGQTEGEGGSGSDAKATLVDIQTDPLPGRLVSAAKCIDPSGRRTFALLRRDSLRMTGLGVAYSSLELWLGKTGMRVVRTASSSDAECKGPSCRRAFAWLRLGLLRMTVQRNSDFGSPVTDISNCCHPEGVRRTAKQNDEQPKDLCTPRQSSTTFTS